MFVLQEEDDICVYDNEGHLRHKSLGVVQYQKFNSTSLVVITDDTIEFIQEFRDDERDINDILVTVDADFESASIEKNLVLVKRKYLMDVLDVYNDKFINLLRLYKNFKGQWVHLAIKYKIPVKIISPRYVNNKYLFGVNRGKPCIADLDSGNIKKLTKPKGAGIKLDEPLSKFSKGEKGK